MQKFIVTVLFCLVVTQSFAADKLETDDQKTFYALGQIMGHQLSLFSLTPSELETIKEGLSDAVTGKPSAVDLETYGPKVEQLAMVRKKALGEKQAALSKEFLEKTAKEKGAVKTDSGLIYFPLQEGTGATPGATDTVKVNYRGSLIDGKEFDSSYKRGTSLEFKLDSVIKCWGEGVRKMKVGGKAKLVCPSSIAYEEKGAGGGTIPPNAALVFEVELLDIKK
jgi:FKBP-type peptidyl-prolyl cis-trans isomerase FkpA